MESFGIDDFNDFNDDDFDITTWSTHQNENDDLQPSDAHIFTSAAKSYSDITTASSFNNNSIFGAINSDMDSNRDPDKDKNKLDKDKTSDVPYDCRLLPLLIPPPVTHLRSHGEEGFINIMDFWVKNINENGALESLFNNDTLPVVPESAPLLINTTVTSQTLPPKKRTKLTNAENKEKKGNISGGILLPISAPQKHGTGGKHWQWCQQRARSTGIPYPRRKDVILMYLIQRGLSLQSEMIDFLVKNVHKLTDTFFTRDNQIQYRQIEAYLGKAHRVKSGPWKYTNSKKHTRRRLYCDWFRPRQRDCSEGGGNQYNDYCYGVNVLLSHHRRLEIQEDYKCQLKKYVKQYALPSHNHRNIYSIVWPKS